MALIHILLLRRDSAVAAFLTWEADPFLWSSKDIEPPYAGLYVYVIFALNILWAEQLSSLLLSCTYTLQRPYVLPICPVRISGTGGVGISVCTLHLVQFVGGGGGLLCFFGCFWFFSF